MSDPHVPGSGLAAALTALAAVAGFPSERLLGQLAEHLGGITFELDAEGRVVRSVGAPLRDIERERGPSVGRLVSEMYPDVPELLSAVRRALTGACVEVEVELDGIWYIIEYAPLFGGDGTVTRVVGFASLRDAGA